MPGPDEALASWVDRTALIQEVSRKVLLPHLGLSEPGAHPVGLGLALTGDQRRALAETTGIPSQQFASMTMDRFSKTCLDFASDWPGPGASNGSRVWVSNRWVYHEQSSACPSCLDENGGAWPVHWKLPWQFMCLAHGTFLLHHCICGRALYSSRRTTQVERCPHLATNPRHDAPRSDAELSSSRRKPRCGVPVAGLIAPSVEDGVLQRLQVELLKLVDARGPQAEQLARTSLSEIRSLFSLVLYLAPPESLRTTDPRVQERFARHCDDRDGVRQGRYRAYAVTPTDPLLIAAGLAMAADLVFAREPEAAMRELVGATERSGMPRKRWHKLSAFWQPPERFVGVVAAARSHHAAAVSAHLDGRYRARNVAHARLSWRHVPQLLWNDVFDYVSGGILGVGWRDHQRRFASLSLARTVSPELTTWAAAAEALGLPTSVAPNCHAISSELRQERLGEAFSRRLEAVVSALDAQPVPIDLAARRESLADLRDLDPDRWHDVVTSTGLKVVSTLWIKRRTEAAAWIWATATGGDFHFAPALNLQALSRAERRVAENRYRQYFVPTALPRIREPLIEYGATILRDRRLTGSLQPDEPMP